MGQRGIDILSAISRWLVNYRIVILLFVIAIAAGSAYFHNKIPRDPSVEAMVLEDDPDLIAYNHFKEVFGSDEFLLLAAQVEDIFDPQLMADVEALREKIEVLDHIEEVTAFTNARTIRGRNDEVIVEAFVPEIPKTEEAIEELRKRALIETDFIGNYYTADLKTFTVLARLETLDGEKDSTETRTALTEAIREMVKQSPFDKYKWWIAGVPVLKSDLAETQKKENVKFELIIFSLLSIVLFIIFRTISGTLITLAAVQAGIFILMAGHYFSGIPLTMVSTILTPLMLIYGVSSSVHIQTHYALHSQLGKTRRNALIAAVAATLIPCLFNSVTTAVGLGSNCVSSIRPIREFGMFASLGVIVSFFIVFLVVPPFLSFFRKPGAATRKANESGLRVVVLEAIVNLVLNRRKTVIFVSLTFLALAIYGMSLIKVETDLLGYFRPESPIRSSYNFIDENISGISSMEFVIDTGRKNGMKDPEILKRMERLLDHLRDNEDKMTSIISIESVYKRIRMALHGDDPKQRLLPETRQEAAQYLLLYSMSGPESDLYDFVSPDYRYGRISSRLHTMPSSGLAALVDRIKSKTSEVFGSLEKDGVTVKVTGSAVLYANMNASLVWGQIKSFSLSMLLISIMMILVAGEFGLGIVSLLPNLMPIAMVMGFMGYSGYALDSTSAMVAPIALGMAVDSTIHFMVRFRREFLSSQDYNTAAAQTVRIIGRAMLGTSIPLAVGFLVLTTSEFFPVYVFGLLSGIVVVLAMAFDLLLTPICMMLYRPKYKKKGLIDFFE